MPSAISNPKKNRRPTRLAGQQRPMQREIPISIVSVTPAGDTITIVFNQVVSLSGIPQYLKNGTIAPIAASMSSPTTLVLTYPTPVGPPVPAADITVPGEDSAIRSASAGTHWRDAKPIVLPGMKVEPEQQKTLPPTRPPESRQPRAKSVMPLMSPAAHSEMLRAGHPAGKVAVVSNGKIRYLDRADYVPEVEPAKPKREPKPRVKNDPKLVAAARELRDRYLEQMNHDHLLSPGNYTGKYEVGRALPDQTTREDIAAPILLPEAA